MTKYTNPFNCLECGKLVMANQPHSYNDCIKEKKRVKEQYEKRVKAVMKNDI